MELAKFFLIWMEVSWMHTCVERQGPLRGLKLCCNLGAFHQIPAPMWCTASKIDEQTCLLWFLWQCWKNLFPPPCSKLRNKTGRKKSEVEQRVFSPWPVTLSDSLSVYIVFWKDVSYPGGKSELWFLILIPSADMNNGSHLLAVSSTFTKLVAKSYYLP